MSSKILDAIFWVKFASQIEGQEFLSGGGTGFVIFVEGKGYFVTARHVVKDYDINDIYISSPNYEDTANIPFNQMIHSIDTTINEPNDVCLFAIDTQKLETAFIREHPVQEFTDIVVNSKRFKNICSLACSSHRKFKKIIKTKAYLRSNQKVARDIEESKMFLMHIKDLPYDPNPVFQDGEQLRVLGYPHAEQSIDYEQNHIKETLVLLVGEYSKISKLPNPEYHTFRYKINDKNHDLNGFSGAPVLNTQKKVVGMMTNGGNGFAYFIDMNFILKHLEQ